MEIEKLIEQLRTESLYADKASLEIMDLCMDAATALSTLQAENAQLRAELEYEREHANAYYEECGQWEAENEKLRAELEQVKRERDAAIRDLEMVSVCDTCVHEHAPSCPGCNDAENWEWRGPEEG